MATAAQITDRLDRHLRTLGHAIVGVSIGDAANKATWMVQPTSLQAACQAAIDAFNPDDTAAIAVDVTVRAQVTSRQKDILTTCALIVRARGIPAWNAMTVPQKVAAANAEADVWRDIRIWVEGNL